MPLKERNVSRKKKPIVSNRMFEEINVFYYLVCNMPRHVTGYLSDLIMPRVKYRDSTCFMCNCTIVHRAEPIEKNKEPYCQIV
jgi:hypothetical protein